MGCCLSRPKEEKKKPEFREYSTEGSLTKRISSEGDELIDTRKMGSKLVAKDRYSTERHGDNKLNLDANMEGDENLPTFNYRAVNSRDRGPFYIDNYDNPIFQGTHLDTFINKNIDYSVDGIDEMNLKNLDSNINLNNISNSPYFSINSNSIVGNYYSKNYEGENSDLFIENRKNVSNVFSKKNFIFLYFEINHFIFWARDYLISLYPEVNLVMVIEINDSKLTQEKIFFTRSKEDANKYNPLKKKIDMGVNNYRILQAFEVSEADRDFPFKISFNFYTYTNHKMISICNDEIFVKMTREGELQKYKMYQNIYMKHYHKKVGNLIFNFAFKLNELYPMDLEEEKSKYLRKFSNLEVFTKFEENQELTFIYYGVENFVIKENGNVEYSKYFSIKEIDEVEIGEELKSEPKLDRLLELVTTVKKKFEFYQIIKKINNYFATKELKEDKLMTFKELLLKRLEEFSEKKELSDKILVPFIFTALKKACFKIKPVNGANKKNSSKKLINGNSSNQSLNNSIQKNTDFEKIQMKKTELLISLFNVTFTFLRIDIQEDISLSALNYIFKYLEESLSISVNGKATTTDEYFFEYIVEKKYYTKFCDMILKYFEYQACVQPIFSILAKIIRLKKTNCQELIDFFNTDKFSDVLKKIIRIHDCNSIIMSNIFSTLFNLIDYMDINNILYIVSIQRLKEVFNIFKMTGFDFIHESILNLVKAILLKKSDKLPRRSNSLSTNDSNYKSAIDANSILNTNITDEEYTDIIIIFSNALIFIRNKILMLDFFKLSRWVYAVMTHLYTMSNIINNTNPKKLPKMVNVIAEKKIVEYLIECLSVISDKKIFVGIDTAFEILDLNLIKIKIMIFRTIFHCLILVKTLKDLSPSTLPKHSAEKLIRIIKVIENNDMIYNPVELFKTIESNTKKNKVDQYTENLLLLHRNLQDYYNRYKSKAPDYVKELMSVVKK